MRIKWVDDIIEDVFICVHDEQGLDVIHDVGLDHKPYCGISLDGSEWSVLSSKDEASIPYAFCADCLAEQAKRLMAEAQP